MEVLTSIKKLTLETKDFLEERSLLGLWRQVFGIPEDKPSALPVDGFPGDEGFTWEDWHRQMRDRYPVRHFLGEELPTYLGRARRVFWKDPTYFLISHLVPWRRYHMVDIRSTENGYTYGWKDTSDRLMYALFALLVDFVEEEYPGHVDWNYDEEIRKIRDEFITIYRWWKFERPREQAEFWQEKQPAGLKERLRSVIFEDILRPVVPFGKSDRQKGQRRSEEELEQRQHREEELKRKDDEMCKRLIDIRHYLWT